MNANESAPAIDKAFLNVLTNHRRGAIVSDVSAAIKQATSALPPMIMGGIAVFQGSNPYMVPARLKSRCEDRRLVLFFETVALHAIVRESILLLVKQVAEKTKIVPLLGVA
jgi:hypothetical protein